MPVSLTPPLSDFSTGVAVHSEEDAKQKIIMPYLRSLGYSEKEMRFENPITVQAGSRKVTLYSDIEILVDGRPEIIIDAKKPSHTINDTDVLQVTSYAKLVDVQSAYCAFVTNGHDLKGVNVSTGAAMPGIPSKNQLISSLSRRPKNILTGIQLREVRSTLVTIMSQDVLYRVIKECKDIIEKQALIRSDQSFKEMTKILLVKMNEERRALKEARENRFSRQWLQVSAEASGAQQLEVFRKLFEEATNKYSGIYDDDDVSIQIKDEDALLKVVDRLEPFSFLGTGDDIKGAVYEIFLKTTLRGEFDQYFTPRELVDYIVEASDPQYGERFVDPAAGSGGFLIKAFTHVNQVLQTSGRPAHDILVDERELVEKHIWGQEADYDLHVLTKINMIMHGDGWNNIYQGDSLLGGHLPYGTFDLVLENPPFTTSYGNKAVLKNYETAFGRDSQELDILFVELSIRLLKPGGRMFIILPEGLLNLPAYRDFRLAIGQSLAEPDHKPSCRGVPTVRPFSIQDMYSRGDQEGRHIRPSEIRLRGCCEQYRLRYWKNHLQGIGTKRPRRHSQGKPRILLRRTSDRSGRIRRSMVSAKRHQHRTNRCW